MSKYNLTEIFNESFDSLAKKLDKQKGIDKEDAAKIAGSIAAKKMAGAGKGPTAKQKARVKEEEVSDTEQVFDIIYAAGGKDKAPDFMDAIGEEFEIPFEFGRVDEQKEPVSEITSDTRNRIDGMVNQKFLSTFLTSFGEMYADLSQDDPFDSEDVLEFLEGEMRSMLKEKGMYEDSFNPDDMKESIKEDEEEEEEEKEKIVQYKPFIDGETFLRKQMFSSKVDNYDYLLEDKEQYDFLIQNGVSAFLDKYDIDEGTDYFEFDDSYEDFEGKRFSLGHEGGLLTPIQEDLFSKDGDTEDNVDNIDKVSSPSTKGVGYDQVSKANTAEDDMESKETLNPKPMYEDLKKHFKRFM